nr:immunoglobulin heavy chain junction region [Mus musculus]
SVRDGSPITGTMLWTT